MEFSTGMCLRFPRIVRMRFDLGDYNGGEKPIEDCMTVSALKALVANRKSAERMKHSKSNDAVPCRFLTQNERVKIVALNKRRAREEGGRTKEKKLGKSTTVARGTNISVKSNIFAGLTFCVLAGTYRLTEKDVEYAEAKEMNFWKTLRKVKNKQDVERFIFQHGGKCIGEVYDGDHDLIDYYVGGLPNDPKVVRIRKGVETINFGFAENEWKVKEKITAGRWSKMKREKFTNMSNVFVVKWTWVFRTGKDGERSELQEASSELTNMHISSSQLPKCGGGEISRSKVRQKRFRAPGASTSSW